MTAEIWAKILEQMPTVAVILVVGYVLLKYVDRWVTQIAQGQAAGSQTRQQEIIVLLERTLAATQMVENKLAEVVERNTRVLDATTVTLTHIGEGLAVLMQAQGDSTGRLQHVEQLMLDHEKDVAARPCIIDKRQRGRTGGGD